MNRQLFDLIRALNLHLEVKMVEEPEVEVESVFPQVPSRDHWFQFSIAPDDFDPEKVWTVIQRSRTILGGDSWQCVILFHVDITKMTKKVNKNIYCFFLFYSMKMTLFVV